MKIENGKEEKIKEINEKLNPVAKYTYGEDSGYPNGFNFDQTEVSIYPSRTSKATTAYK